ncbi:hypothetical protein PoB_004437200 [Plakobranchus ocellatus]|uniref:Uncharacterized protein n=1 Tax=Plakobranchus ocellatus TaxID=259542 RepID=A0AAV4BFZ1_9GAST|nr:hypothetical protein PoB_004437200 [Plakobranchus ocellatus]
MQAVQDRQTTYKSQKDMTSIRAFRPPSGEGARDGLRFKPKTETCLSQDGFTVFVFNIFKAEVEDLCIASPQQGDLSLSGSPPGQGAGGGAQNRDRGIPVNVNASLPSTAPLVSFTTEREK